MLNRLNAYLESLTPAALHRVQTAVQIALTLFLLFLLFFAVPSLVSAIFGPDWLS